MSESNLQALKLYTFKLFLIIGIHVSVAPSKPNVEMAARWLSLHWLSPMDYITQGIESESRLLVFFFFFFYDSDILKNKSSKQAGSLLFDVVGIPSWSCDL